MEPGGDEYVDKGMEALQIYLREHAGDSKGPRRGQNFDSPDLLARSADSTSRRERVRHMLANIHPVHLKLPSLDLDRQRNIGHWTLGRGFRPSPNLGYN